MKPWMRRLLEAVVGGAALVAAVTWLSGGCGERVGPGQTPPHTRVAPPEAATAAATLERLPVVERVAATLASARRTTVASRILARIEEIPVRAGSTVQQGDLLVRLDDRDLRARVAEVEQALQAARARLALAASEMQRVERLFEQGVTTRQRLDEARSELRVARAEVERLERSLEEARAALSHAEIRAPVTGRVVDRLAEPGDTAVPGQPLLEIYDPTALRAEAAVRETLAVRLAPDDPLAVEIPSLERRVIGRIDEIVPFADPGARTLLVKVRIPSEPGLVAGLFARVEVPAGEEARLWVPAAAVVRIGQLELVEVVDGEGRLERRLVTTGRDLGEGRIEVLSGLSAGERVLVAPGPARAQGPGAPDPLLGPLAGRISSVP